MKNWSLEDLSTLDATEAVAHSKELGFDVIQMLKDDNDRWTLYIKPEGRVGFAVYPDKGDLNQFFTTLKQSMDNIGTVRMELAQKYFAMAETKPELKVNLFGGDNGADLDMNRIQRVSVFKAKNDTILCAATIDGRKLQPRSVTPSQWQRMWIAPDKDTYKKSLAAALFADVLRKDNNQAQTSNEKQEEQVEQKQQEQPIVKEEKQEETASEKQNMKEELKTDPILKQYIDLKRKHPDAILLFRCGDFYESYKEDAVKVSSILGITLTRSSRMKDDEGKPLQMAGFPFHTLDSYLPKLVRSGERIAICDQLEAPRRQAAQENKQEEQQRSAIRR